MFKLKKLFVASAALAATGALIVSSPSVFAADAATTSWDYSKLTSGVDFASIGVGVLAVAGILAGVYAGIRGAKIVLGFLKAS